MQDACHAVAIYGSNIPSIKGKTTKGGAVQVPSFIPLPLPTPIMDEHQHITLCIDFFVQGQPFFTLSHGI